MHWFSTLFQHFCYTKPAEDTSIASNYTYSILYIIDTHKSTWVVSNIGLCGVRNVVCVENEVIYIPAKTRNYIFILRLNEKVLILILNLNFSFDNNGNERSAMWHLSRCAMTDFSYFGISWAANCKFIVFEFDTNTRGAAEGIKECFPKFQLSFTK